MDWKTEKYVRLYIHDTAEFLEVSPLARWFFWDLLRRVDSQGHIPLGQRGLKSLCPLVHAPWSMIGHLVDELLADGCLIHDPARSMLLIKNFIPAQTAERQGSHPTRRGRKAKHNRTSEPSAPEATDGLVD